MWPRRSDQLSVISVLLAALAVSASASDLDEFKVKREQVFGFAQKPKVSRDGDKVTISFASKGYCDATAAIENEEGKIIRHLASGVLGVNAPSPFQKNALEQTIVWDGKDDQGKYVDDKDALTVRVSLGLRARFERTLFWSPYKRVGFMYPVLRAAPEGVYICEGYALDHIRLFDHQGNYARTVYPFPADKLARVTGLQMHTFVQDGQRLPLKGGYHQATLLTCGSNRNIGSKFEGYGVNAMAVRDGRLALVHRTLNRMGRDGSSGGMALDGPATAVKIAQNAGGWGHPEDLSAPLSVALSPDRKWLYLAGYQFTARDTRQRSWLNGVARMAFEGDEAPEVFVGSLIPGERNGGTGVGQFRGASSVAVDAKGRVYAADYMNDRVQVFDADGKHLKSIPVSKPACVAVHQKTGDIFVFSWLLQNRLITVDQTGIKPTYIHLGPLADPRVKTRCPLPLRGHNSKTAWNSLGGVQHRVELDSWAPKPTIWAVNGASGRIGFNDDGSFRGIQENWRDTCVEIFEEQNGKLVRKKSFGDVAKRSVTRLKAPILWRQRLYASPANGRVYVAEGDCGVMKAFNQLVELDPATGKARLIDLPMGAEDLCFDVNGNVYLRTDTIVARYDPATWREIPWDYGEERERHSYGMGARGANLVAGLVTPGHRSFNFWHLGGIDISMKGHLVVTTCNSAGMRDKPKWARGEAHFDYKGQPYAPRIFPGRMRWGEIHIFDKHGKLLLGDVVPGMGHLNGVGIDADDNLYMLLASRRLHNGKPCDPGLKRDASGTVVKVPPVKARALAAGRTRVPVPLTRDTQPKRPMDVAGYNTGWLKGAEWLYGGVGFCTPGGCVCWNSRFDLDYFNRSFAPETLHYSVAVLDSSGNLILRVGKYGNVDDGKPLVNKGGPPKPRSIGGDEVALFHACYVATHTDRRLFIADAGNARILSVKLGYHATEKVALKNVAEAKK